MIWAIAAGSQASNATYEYIKVVDLDRKGTATGMNAVDARVDGTTEIFTIGGTKIGQLQKGITLVRKADGKVVKVFVK